MKQFRFIIRIAYACAGGNNKTTDAVFLHCRDDILHSCADLELGRIACRTKHADDRICSRDRSFHGRGISDLSLHEGQVGILNRKLIGIPYEGSYVISFSESLFNEIFTSFPSTTKDCKFHTTSLSTNTEIESKMCWTTFLELVTIVYFERNRSANGAINEGL